MEDKRDESVDITNIEETEERDLRKEYVNQKNGESVFGYEVDEDLERYELEQYNVDEIIYEKIESKKVSRSIGLFLFIWGVILGVYILIMEYVGINDIKVYFIVFGVSLVIGYKSAMKYILYKIRKRKGEWENG